MNNRPERGSALLLVTWVLMIVGIIATFLIYRSQSEWAYVIKLEQEQKLSQIATAVLNERLALLESDDSVTDTAVDPWFGSGGRVDLERDGFKVTVLIEDEGSKPNLNLINAKALEVSVADQASPDPILDWRDIDSEPRTEGAETAYYQSLNPSYKARNGFFSTVTELRQVKEGDKLYDLLAPNLSVYGRINPNTIDKETFAALLLSIGFDQPKVETLAQEFADLKSTNKHFDSLIDLRLASLGIFEREKLQPWLTFTGACNLNLVGTESLKMALVNAGFKSDLAKEIISRRDSRPFEADEIENFFKQKTKNTKFKARDYFTTESRIIRFKIWLIGAERRYYLETVYERAPARLSGSWRVYPLSWSSSNGASVPEIPRKTLPEAAENGGEQPFGTE